jgi:hypothetical protein
VSSFIERLNRPGGAREAGDGLWKPPRLENSHSASLHSEFFYSFHSPYGYLYY